MAIETVRVTEPPAGPGTRDVAVNTVAGTDYPVVQLAIGDEDSVEGLAGAAIGMPMRFQRPATSGLTEAIIDTATSGDNTIVAGVSAQTIRVFRLFLVCDADVTVTVKDGASTALTGAIAMKAGGAIVLDFDGEPWFTTSAAEDFVIALSAAVGIRGRCYYTQG